MKGRLIKVIDYVIMPSSWLDLSKWRDPCFYEIPTLRSDWIHYFVNHSCIHYSDHQIINRIEARPKRVVFFKKRTIAILHLLSVVY